MLLPKMRVLIVDDNPTDRLIVRGMLIKLGCKEIQEAEDGSIAERKMLTAVEIGAAFDLVILDWNMPKTKGSKLLEYVRKAFKTRNTKIIIMTATADRSTVDDAVSGGADDFLVKPISIEALQEKIKKFES